MSCWVLALAVAFAGQLGARYGEFDGAADSSSEQPPGAVVQPDDSPAEGGQTAASSESPVGSSFAEEGAETEDQSLLLDSEQEEESSAVGNAPVTGDYGTTPPSSDPLDPEELLKRFSEPPLRGALNGKSASLDDVLAGATSRDQQTKRVVAYWELAIEVAQYYVALDEATEFEALQQAVAQPSELWDRAATALESHLSLKRAGVLLAQQKLAAHVFERGPDFAPLPSDLPFCGEYNTRYDEIFQLRPTPLAESYSRCIPLTFGELQRSVEAVGLNRKWVYATSMRRSPQSDGTELLMAFEGYVNARRQFLDVVKEYNLEIIRYTELASPQALGGEQLVSMLIRRPVATTVDPNVQSANAEQEINRADSTTQPPGSSNWSVPSGGEHSILVPQRS